MITVNLVDDNKAGQQVVRVFLQMNELKYLERKRPSISLTFWATGSA